MTRTFSSALDVQARVIWALCLREIHGKHGKSRLGYLWQLIKTGFGVAVFWWIREMAGFSSPMGLPTPIFLLMGFIPWFIFAETLNMTMEAVRTNKALLTFPQVTPLDLYLSSAIVAWCTEIVVLGLYLVAIKTIGYDFYLYDPTTFIFSLLGVGFLGTGLGLVLSALNLYVPIIEKLVPMVMRVLFLITGIFFSPTQMASIYGDKIMLIPTANFIELLRGAFAGKTPVDAVNTNYIICITVIFCIVGLLLERHVRFKLES